jgi:hypothetical protein
MNPNLGNTGQDLAARLKLFAEKLKANAAWMKRFLHGGSTSST